MNQAYSHKIEEAFPLLRGWCVQKDSPEAIFNIEVYVNGSPQATVDNGLVRNDLKKKKVSAGQGGFSLDLSAIGFAPGTHSLILKFPDGSFSEKKEFVVSAPEYEFRVESILPALKGWCIDKGRPERLLHLDIYVDDAALASVVNDCRRDDLAKSGKSAGSGGFLLAGFEKLAPSGKHLLKIGFPDGSFSESIAFEVLAPEYELQIERMPPDLAGWCLDRTRPRDSFPLEIFVDGKYLGKTDNSGPREDLKKYRARRGGFKFDSFAGIQPGRHQLRIKFPDGSFSRETEFALLLPEYAAKIERQGDRIRGWCVDKNDRGRIFDLDLYLDGQFYATLRNDQQRNDLVKKHLSNGRGGFSLPDPAPCLQPGRHFFQIRYPESGFSERFQFQAEALNPPDIFDPYVIEKPVCVIVPVESSSTLRQEWLDALLRHTPDTENIIFAVDSSLESAISLLRKGTGGRRTRILEIPGFPAAGALINTALAEAGDIDIAIVSTDVTVAGRWLNSLRIVAYGGENTGSASAIQADFFRSWRQMPEEEPAPDPGQYELFAKAWRRSACSCPVTLEKGSFGCIFIRRECLRDAGTFSDAADTAAAAKEFFRKSAAAGWRNLLDTATCVFLPADRRDANGSFAPAAESPSSGASMSRMQSAFWQLALAAWRGREALCANGKLLLPRALYVQSTSAGGTPAFTDDLIHGLRHRVHAYELKCNTRMIWLYEYRNNGERTLIFEYELDEIVDQVSHVSHEYNAVLTGILLALDIDIVHIQALIWHSLGLVGAARNLGCKVVYNIHDYYPVSPNLNLVDDAGDFMGKNYVKSGSAYRTSLWPKPFPLESPSFRRFWRRRFQGCLSQCDALVTPAESVKEHLLAAMQDMGGLAESNFHLIAHGRDFEKFHTLATEPDPDEKLRILIAGNINFNKGMGIIMALAEYDEAHGQSLEFHIAGDCSTDCDIPSIKKHGKYRRGELPALIDRIRPHAAAFFSIWNEIWCYSLSEVWAAGVPAFVLDFPTLAERVRQSGAGWILEGCDIPQMHEQILATMGDACKIQTARAAALEWQRMSAKKQDVRAMADAYLDLYRQLLKPGAGAARRGCSLRRPARNASLTAFLLTAGLRRTDTQILLQAICNVAEAVPGFRALTFSNDRWLKEYAQDSGFLEVLELPPREKPDLAELLEELAVRADLAIIPAASSRLALWLMGALDCLEVPCLTSGDAMRHVSGSGRPGPKAWQEAIIAFAQMESAANATEPGADAYACDLYEYLAQAESEVAALALYDQQALNPRF